MTTTPSDAVTSPAGSPRRSRWSSASTPSATSPTTRNDRPLSHAQTIRNLVEQGVLADQVGVDFFGIGEHHTDDFPLSAADVVLGAIAARTSRIHLGSAVTVLELGRSGPGVSALLHAQRRLRRAGRGHPGTRLQHRLVPALRLRPGRLRGPLRGEGEPLRRAPQGRPGHLAGQDPRVAARPGCRAAHRIRALPGVDRRRRKPAVGHPRRTLRLLADAGDHRRLPGALRAFLRALPAGPGALRASPAAGRRALAGSCRRD